MGIYDHKKIEKKWQKQWERDGLYKACEDQRKEKCYVLDMFPYPSGDGLHVGHPKGYIATDIYSRFKKMSGFNILHPMGWDAFGLPAENFAIKNKVHPRVAVKKNIKRFKEQLRGIGFNYDWEREINTTDPKYYRWTQWVFLKMFEKGLAYESHEPINWCPSCQTGLANEDLDGNACERCGTIIEKRLMRQWILKITAYADRLLRDLDSLHWPESIKTSQRNWIGRSEGTEIDFKLVDVPGQKDGAHSVKVFTTRSDTLFGATFLAISAELAWKWIENGWQVDVEIKEYVEKTIAENAKRSFKEKEKTGIFSGVSAINPAHQEKIPVWIVNYVLGDVGTGAVMAVPAHDERDFEFAKKYQLPIRQVVAEKNVDIMGVGALIETKEGNFVFQKRGGNASTHPNTIALFGGGIEKNEDVFACVRRELEEELSLKLEMYHEINVIGDFESHNQPERYLKAFHVRNVDRNILELREGEAIVEMTLDDAEKNSHVTDFTKDVIRAFRNGINSAFVSPGILINSGKFDGMTSSEANDAITKFVGEKKTVVYKLRDWVFSRQRYWGEPIPIIHCEQCGIVPVPESDLPVMLPEVESYAPTGTGESPLADISEWVNVKCPKCSGQAKRETNTMPQWAGSSWYYLRYIDPRNESALVDKEKEKYWSPVDMYVGGAEHATRHLIYARFWHKFLYDIGVVNCAEPFARLEHVGLIAAEDGRKMSKRYGNVVNPDDIVATYGADTLRLYEMFMGPFDQGVRWSTDSIVGSRRFIERVWKLQEKISDDDEQSIEMAIHTTIKKVGGDIEQFGFNTAIAQMMILVNEMERVDSIGRRQYEILLTVLAPFAPYVVEDIWNGALGHLSSIHEESWPSYNEERMRATNVVITVQINGKVRDHFSMPADSSGEKVESEALAREGVQKWIAGKEIKRVIYVKNKIVSIVI